MDNQLTDRLRQADESAFKEIFEKYYRQLVISSYQILKDENVSKDAAQEVFFELWKNREKLKNGLSLLPYLRRGVINRSLNILKSRKHHMSSGAAPLDYLRDKERRPDQIYEDGELRNVVFTAIDKMPERCRAIFMLCRMEGLSHIEIAKKLEISTKTIENQMTKALKIMRAEIRNYQELLQILAFTMLIEGWGNCFFGLFNCYDL